MVLPPNDKSRLRFSNRKSSINSCERSYRSLSYIGNSRKPNVLSNMQVRRGHSADRKNFADFDERESAPQGFLFPFSPQLPG